MLMFKMEESPMEIRTATLDDVPDISRIHALSWKAAYKGIVPQAYLDGLKEDCIHLSPASVLWKRIR